MNVNTDFAVFQNRIPIVGKQKAADFRQPLMCACNRVNAAKRNTRLHFRSVIDSIENRGLVDKNAG